MTNLGSIVSDFSRGRVLVIGDVMLDRYIRGDANRLSPEAPVPVIDVVEETNAPRGAGNVAANIASYGATCTLIGVIGEDYHGQILTEKLRDRHVQFLSVKDAYTTTTKVRVLGASEGKSSQAICRVDYGDHRVLGDEMKRLLLGAVSSANEEYDVIVISDYAKGTLPEDVLSCIIREHIRGKTMIVDPKPQHAGYYKGASIITPSIHEAIGMASALGKRYSQERLSDEARQKVVIEMGKELSMLLDARLLITQGAHGMTLCDADEAHHYPTKAREVYDVTGAGDSVVATIATALSVGASLQDAIHLANHAAGIVVGKSGTVSVSCDELLQSLQER